MKRNPNLVNLSSEHHDGLVIALRIKKGVDSVDNQAIILDYILQIWPELLHHFEQEEDNFLAYPSINRAHPEVNRMIQEHQQFADLVQELNNNPTDLKDKILAFSNLLKDHIRFEERILFPYLESILTEVELQEIGRNLANSHQPLNPNCGVAFW